MAFLKHCYRPLYFFKKIGYSFCLSKVFFYNIEILIKLRNSKQKKKIQQIQIQTQTQKIQNQTQHVHNSNTTCSKIQEHKQNISFNETNPNRTHSLFKENKSINSETPKHRIKNTNPFTLVYLKPTSKPTSKSNTNPS